MSRAAMILLSVGVALFVGLLAFGTGFTFGYLMKNQGGSTYSGAFGAFWQGFTFIPEWVWHGLQD